MSPECSALATEITAELLLHKIWGPRKKSWGIEMTIATSLLRGVGHHTGLIGIVSSNSPWHSE
jgi:hypothetical protein